MKKIIALVLSLMLLVAFSIGCKPAEQPKQEAPAPAAPAAPEKPAEAPAAPAAPAAPEKPAEAPKAPAAPAHK